MCGICGIFDVHRRTKSIVQMNEAQRHRGPDGEGYIFINTLTDQWQSTDSTGITTDFEMLAHTNIDPQQYDLVLASRRLAILDLSPAGHMPMYYGNDEFWLTYNGEIFNYQELRHDLINRGYQFRSKSDTEVILAAYAEWGVDCLRRLNGMFAFALWDSKARRIFCARDRFGIKPFYYYWNGELLLFSSELKSILQHPAAPRQPNDQIIFDYLTLGVSDHTEQTFFEDIQALAPGTFFLLDVAQQEMQVDSWWEIKINPQITNVSPTEEKQRFTEFADILEDSIRIRLRSDVPVGTALSGGLDSSAIAVLANRLLRDESVIAPELVGQHQKTFTARNHENQIDEHCYSRLVVEQTGAAEHFIFPDGNQLWQELEKFVWFLDEPVNSTSQYAQWNVMRLAKRNGVTVLLDGQGGDEIFAGYHSYYMPYLSQIYNQQGMLSALHAAYDVTRIGGAPVRDILFDDTVQRLPWRLRQMIDKLRTPLVIPGGGGSGMQEWQLQPDFIQRNWNRRWQPTNVDENGLVGILQQDLTATNLPKLLRYEDRISMAFSLETRLPYLDYRLVDMVFGLPLNYRIHRGWSKWILRRSMENVLPKEICWRRNKLGFPTPEEHWLRQGAGYIRALFQQYDRTQITAYIQPDVLKQLSDLPDAQLAATPGLWRIVNLLVWHEIFFHHPISPEGLGAPGVDI